MISIPSPIEKPCECLQETILWEGFHRVCECSGGVVAVSARYGCTVRSSIAAFRVADPGFKSRPEHPCSFHIFLLLLGLISSHQVRLRARYAAGTVSYAATASSSEYKIQNRQNSLKSLRGGVYAKESVHESPSVGDTGRETHTRNHALAG